MPVPRKNSCLAMRSPAVLGKITNREGENPQDSGQAEQSASGQRLTGLGGALWWTAARIPMQGQQCDDDFEITARAETLRSHLNDNEADRAKCPAIQYRALTLNGR
jgi:hypothetical protein